MDPPMTGHAVQYERLWLEEVALEKERVNILQSSSSSLAEDNDDEQQQQCRLENYQFRSMIHRASLEGMLISAQCAATKVTSHNNNSKSSSSLPNYERGLENEDSVNALLALRDIKMRELEEANNKLPFANIGGSSSARCWKQNFPLGAESSSSSSKQEAATANSFFNAFPECKRSLNTADESDENDSDDDDDEIVQQQQSKSKRKGKGTSPIVVSSPSPDRPPNNDNDDDEVQLITTSTKSQLQQLPTNSGGSNCQKQQFHTQNKHNTNVSSSITSNHQHNQDHKSRGGYQQHQHAQSQGQHGQNRVNNNNNNNLPTLPRHNNVNYHNPYQNHHHQSAAAAKFDYNDTSGGYDEQQQQQQQQSNSNPFRTANELGPNFDPKRRQQQQQEQQHRGGGGGRRDNRNNNWDDYENDNNTSNNSYSGGNRLAGGGGGGRSGSGPQQMVRAAIRGPNMSAGLKRKFQPPLKREGSNGGPAQSNSGRNQTSSSNNSRNNSSNNSNPSSSNGNDDEELPEELRGLDKELIEKINNEIVDNGQKVTFDDIAGLENAKNTVNELVIFPMKRPDLFTGLRACPKGLLLFGPPGTGKTLIGKAISHESGATFFSISSSSLTSKWIGEGEKLVKTLFAVASYRSPSVVFIDEVDSMLTQRKSDENEASRRIKTEFLVQLDGAGNDRKGHVLVIGATNLPQELDDAARRRFVKRLYIPLPDQPGRETLLRTLLAKNRHSLTDKEIIKLSRDTDGYSGADLKNLCTDAAMGPMRTMTAEQMMRIDANDVPPIAYKHFRQSLRGSSPSVAQADLQAYIDWNNTYGSKISNDSDDDDDDEGEEED